MTLLELLPGSVLFAMMLAMGMGLAADDFRRVVAQPKAAVLGLAGQLVLLPAVAAGLVVWLPLSQSIAVGLLLIAACPGGSTSNAFSHLARGDLALSISLTAVSSLLAFLWIPLVLGLALPLVDVGGAAPGPSLLETLRPVLLTTALPLVCGMALRRAAPDRAAAWRGPLLAGSIGVLLLLIAGLPMQLAARSVDLPRIFAEATVPVLLLLTATMGVSLVAARAAGIDARRARTLAIEVGIQNFALAMLLALTVLREPTYLATGIVYLPCMLVFAAGMVWLGRREERTPALARSA
ncbi:MAG: bile acid:sodium symporter family protein [Myxococcota bacterium]